MNKLSNQPSIADQFWISDPPGTTKLFSSSLFSQQYLNRSTALFLISFHLLQTIALFIETSFYTFRLDQSELNPFLTQVCNILLCRNTISVHDMNALQILLLVSTVVYLLIANCVITLILKYGKLANSWLAGQWKNLVQIHFYCFFLPIHNLLTETIIQALQPRSNDVWWIAVILCLAEILNIGLCILQFISSVNIKSADPFCLLNEYFCEFSCFERAFISLMNLLVIHQTVINVPSLAMNLINLSLALVHMLLLFYTLPLYSMSVLKCFIFEAGAIFTLTLSNLVFSPISDSITDHQEYILLASLVIAIMFSQVAVNYVQSSISKTLMTVLDYIPSNNTKKTVNKFWFIQSIYYLKSLLEMDFYKPPEYCRYLESLLKNYGLIQHLNNFFSRIQTQSTQTQFTSQNIHEVLIGLIDLWTTNNGKSHLLRLVQIDLMTTGLGLKLHKPYFESKELLSEPHLKSNIKLSALSIQDRIQNLMKNTLNHNSSGLNMSVYFERVYFWFNLKQKLALQIEENLNLFNQIQDKNPDLSSFIDLGHKIQTCRSDVEKFYKQVPQRLLNSNLPVMLIYSLYKIKINFEYKDGRVCLERFKALSQRKNESDNNDKITEETLLNVDNTVFIVDTTKKDFGKIVFCSQNTKQIFGEQSNNLIGKHIEVLMSPFFQSVHNNLVIKRLESAEDTLRTSFFKTFARNSQGCIFPVNIVTSLYPSVEKGFYLSAIIRIIKTTLDYILLDEGGYIDSYSEGLKSKLNLPIVMSERNIHILELCANINMKCQSKFRACINGSPAHCIDTEKTSEENITTSPTDNVLYFCPYNSHRCKERSNQLEEQILKMKWTIETKTYDSRKLRVLTLEEVPTQSKWLRQKQTMIQKSEEQEADQDIFPDEKIAETDSILVPNFTEILSPNTLPWKNLTDRENSTERAALKQEYLNTPRGLMNQTDDYLTETPRLTSLQSLTKSGFYMSKKLFQSTQHFNNIKSDENKEQSVTDIELDDIKLEKKAQTNKSVTGKSYQDEITRAIDFQVNIPTLGFYQFSQAKIPVICLIFSLLLLIISSIYVLTIATDKIPILETNFLTLRSSLNRLVALGPINWNLATLIIFHEKTLCDFCMIFVQPTLLQQIVEFSELNLEITRSLDSLSSNFTHFIFEKDIKIYPEDSTGINDFQYFSSIEAANMIADKALHVAQATDWGSAEFMSNLNFLAMNMFNDLLSHFQDEGTLINNEIVRIIDNAQSTSTIGFTITSVFCAITIIVLIVIYLKSYIDTKRFLETFMYFDQVSVDKIVHQMKSFKKSLDSDFKDLHNDFSLNVDFSHTINRKNISEKTPQTRRLGLAIFKRALVLLIFLIVPIIITTVSAKTFTSEFGNIAPKLFSIIKPKQVISQAMLVFIQTGFYNVRRDVQIDNKNISEAVNENIQTLPNLVSEDSLLTINSNYDLFHQDYCKFVNPANYTLCKSLFNGVATSGLTGMVLTLHSFLLDFKKAADLNQGFSTYINDLTRDCYNMLIFANDATDFVQTQGVEELETDLKQIKVNIAVFIVVSFVVCIVLSILGAKYVYFASTSERRDICQLMQVFPTEVVIRNQRLKLFLMKDSRKLREVIQRFK